VRCAGGGDPGEEEEVRKLYPELAKRLAIRLQAALNQVGDCVDDIQLHRPGAAREWLFELDDVQRRLVKLTCRANAEGRAKK
jgi:hypothetical protein